MWSEADPDIADDTPADPSVWWYLALASLTGGALGLWWLGVT